MLDTEGLLNREAVAKALKEIREVFDEFLNPVRDLLSESETDMCLVRVFYLRPILKALFASLDDRFHEVFDEQLSKLGIDLKPDPPARKSRHLN
jgi:hypothetical protein